MKRVLVYRLGSLGDTVVALPFFNRIAERYPDFERVVLTNAPVSIKAAPLLSVLGGKLAHRALAYDAGVRDPRSLLRLRREIRALNAAALIYLMPTRGLANVWRDLAFFAACGFLAPIGAPLTADLDNGRVSASGEEEPETERLARALAQLGPFDLKDPKAWSLHLDAGEIAAGEAVVEPLAGRPYLAVNLGGKAARKDWGLDNWRALAARLAERWPHWGLLAVGAAEDAERSQAVASAWAGPVVNGCGRLAPRASAAAMRGASLFLGHDSGPLHLASVVGVPCVALFGDFNRPRKWHPYLGDNRILHDLRGVRAIGVDQVVAVVADRLP